MSVRSIEYLVKPFQESRNLSINGCADMDLPPFASNPFAQLLRELEALGISPQEYLREMCVRWKKRIEKVLGNPDSLFIMVDIFPNDQERPDLLLDLRSFAITSLEERFISFGSGCETGRYLTENHLLGESLDVCAYGEISRRCAVGETTALVRTLLELSNLKHINVLFDGALCPDLTEGKF